MIVSLKNSIIKLSQIGSDPADDEDTQLQKSLLVVSSVPFMFAGFGWGLMYFYFNQLLAGLIPFCYGLISLLSLVHFGKTRKYRFFRFSQLLLILLLPFFLMIALGGFINGSAVILWAVICPLGALLFDDISHALCWFIAFIGLVILSGLMQSTTQFDNQLPPAVVEFFFVVNIIGSSSIVIMMVFYFVAQKNMFQKKSESLLLNILPKEIATILKHESRTIADHYDEASVLFADMVGFTQLSAELAPVQMVELLNELFSYFDSLLDKYGVEKIRTIGDNYMAVCGVPRLEPDHAQALVGMALEMRDFVASHTFLNDRQVSFRFGINSGSLIAGVVGQKKFVYDVWGDTVNVASRMESHGTAGNVQITRSTYELIKNDFTFEPRRTLNVKGKGEVEVWYVIDRISAA